MPGSVDEPVRFANPFQRIVEVGWGGKYLAFSIRINRDPEYGWAEESCGAGDALPGGVHGIYLTDVDFISLNANGDFDEAYIGSGSGWDGLAPGDVSISGLPSLPSPQSFGSWEVAASAHDNDPETSDDLNTRKPFGRWQEVTGSNLDVATPDGGVFKSASSVDFELIGQTFTSGPTCYEISPGVGNFFMFAPQSAQGPLAGSETSYSLAGVSVTARGKTYSPIGILTIGQSAVGATPVLPGKLWVLCERQVT